jgi:hypothetical protein
VECCLPRQHSCPIVAEPAAGTAGPHLHVCVYPQVRNMTLTVDLAHADGQLPTGCDAPYNPYTDMQVVRITQQDESGSELSSVLLTYRSLSTTSLTKVPAL